MINKAIKHQVPNITRHTRARGFTLVEMLVAVLLLAIAISAPLTIASRGITASVTAKDKITAFSLAQDAIEYVRFKRDSNKLAGNNWLAGLEKCMEGINGCYLDSTEHAPPTPVSCGDSNNVISCPLSTLRYNTSANRYEHTSGPLTLFTRRIIIKSLNSNEAEVTVRVRWCYRTLPTSCYHLYPSDGSEVVVRGNIFNWQ